MAVIGDYWAIMTGGSANIAFTRMWFHSEMNIAFTDIARIKNRVAKLCSEHLQVPEEQARGLIEKPDDALTFFKAQAVRNKAALEKGLMPAGRVYDWKGIAFPKRIISGSVLSIETRSRINASRLADSLDSLSKKEFHAEVPGLSAIHD